MEEGRYKSSQRMQRLMALVALQKAGNGTHLLLMLVVKTGQVMVEGIHEKLNSFTVKEGWHRVQDPIEGSNPRQLVGNKTHTPFEA